MKTFDRGVMIGAIVFIVAMTAILAITLPNCTPTP